MKIQMEQIKLSGETETKPTINGFIDEHGHIHETIRQIHDAEYFEETNGYTFLVEAFCGDMVELHLKEKQIMEMYLFLKKQLAENRYYKHISN